MNEHQNDIIEQTREDEDSKTEEPPMFRVILLNDDYTPKIFVVEILVTIFHKSAAAATELMWQVHNGGRGVAGVYPRDVAETKVAVATTLARENEFPLKMIIEEDR